MASKASVKRGHTVKTFKYANVKLTDDDYRLKRPNVFVGSGSEGVLQAGDKILSINNQDTSSLSHLDAQNLFRKSGTKAQLEIGRVGSPPLDRQTPQAAAGMLQPQLEDQQKLHNQPYRTATCLLPGPKTINEAGIGAPTYQPYRGPQYNTLVQPKNLVQTGGQYNSPRPLYSDENAANTPPHPGFVQSNKLHLPSSNQGTVSKPQQSETFKIVLESEMGGAQNQPGVVGKQFEKAAFIGERPSSQLSDKPKGVDPVMKNTSINQSASFKKVMYSVMGESEF